MLPMQVSRHKKAGLFSVALTTLFLFMLISCKGKKEDKKPLPPVPETKITGISATCVELSKKQVEDEWVKTGHLSNINYVAFFTNYDGATGSFEVFAQAYDKKNNRLGNLISLTPGTNCPHTLPSLAIGENIIDMSVLSITDPSGQLTDFTKVVFTPRKYVPTMPGPVGDYLQYTFVVETPEGPSSERFSLPCPPCQYCRPPNCDTAVIIESPQKKAEEKNSNGKANQ